METLAEWEHDGALSPVKHMSQGIETIPDALPDLFVCNNVGESMVRFADSDQL